MSKELTKLRSEAHKNKEGNCGPDENAQQLSDNFYKGHDFFEGHRNLGRLELLSGEIIVTREDSPPELARLVLIFNILGKNPHRLYYCALLLLSVLSRPTRQ